ncbi:MAG: hypothetical protein IPJ19_05280 [Planctomycetes bacterium]|nr:hypothetical protein [Planctomycetota bacterium]
MPVSLKSPLAARVAIVLASALFLFALVVRGAKPAPMLRPEDQPTEEPRIEQPMQLLARGAALRVGELDRWITKEQLPEWKAVRGSVFSLAGCPETLDWIETAEGQRFERCVASLRSGTRDEAFAALVLVFQLARSTEWKPGMLGHTQHAERVGALLEGWLRAWSGRAAQDPLLVEPSLAALLLYGRVMRVAWRAPVVGYNAAPYERARALISEVVGESAGRTEFGQAFSTRHPTAARSLASSLDILEGFEDECATLYPKLSGDCEER